MPYGFLAGALIHLGFSFLFAVLASLSYLHIQKLLTREPVHVITSHFTSFKEEKGVDSRVCRVIYQTWPFAALFSLLLCGAFCFRSRLFNLLELIMIH